MKINSAKTIRFLTALITFSISFFAIKSVLAAGENQFTIDYNIAYTVTETGETLVNQEATITNLKNDVIPTTYTFSARQLKIYDVLAETNGKSSEPKIEEKNDETLISVTINKYVIGEGRQNKINLTYKTNGIANKTGKIWNIYVPRIQIPDTTTQYNVKLLIPASFGQKIYLSPTPVIEKSEDPKTVAYYFTKETFQSTGITAAFGEYQPVNFKLKYQISGSPILPSIKEIALPPDIKDMQNVSFQTLNPKPWKIKVDEDGNFIAVYILAPLKKLEIEVTGTAKLYGRQINPDFGRVFSELPKDLVNKYTKKQRYWEVNSPYVQKLTQQLKDNKLNVTKNAQKIYNFITQNLTYNFDALNQGSVQRKGAEAALVQKGSWTCMEFTDLFITTARAMGIPSREINGFAFTTEESNKPLSINFKSGDFLHSWAEFYDPFYGWVQIDPTWGTTSGVDYFSKLDTNHFAFVIKGRSSEYPFPAGTYRFSDNEKLIDAALSQTVSEDNFKPKIEVKKVVNFNLIEILKGNMKVKVTNVGGVFVYNLEGKMIPIGSSRYIYIKGSAKEVKYEDLNGKSYTSNL